MKATPQQELALEQLYSRGSLWPRTRRAPQSSDTAERRVVDALVDAGLATWAPHRPGAGVLPHVVPTLAQPTQVAPGRWRVIVPATASPRHAAAMVSGLWRRGAYDRHPKQSWESLSSRARQVGTTPDGSRVVEVEAVGAHARALR